MKDKVFVIIGPTCSGKTSLAIDLCKKYNGEILSADSRQLYKYMDIGTGKLPVGFDMPIKKNDEKWIMDGINVWGYDLVTPDNYFSAYDFAQFALKKMQSLEKVEKMAFLVGGTGFYVDVVTGKVSPSGILPNFELRKELEKKSTAQLNALSTSLNLDINSASERNNKQRLIRTLEKVLSPEKTLRSLPYLDNTEFIFIGFTANRDFLYKKADGWVDEIWSNGVIEEVEHLRVLGYKDSPKLKGLIYGQISDFLDGNLEGDECIQKMKYATHAYIRRQETYFRKMAIMKWFDVGKDSYKQNIYNLVESYVG